MRKSVVVLVMLIGFGFASNLSAAESPAEASNVTWTFFSVVDKPTAEELASASEGEFGKEAACLYDQLENLCVKRVPVVPGDPTTRIVFKKGDIYNAVRRIGKGLEKSVKKGQMTEAEAQEKMLRVLNVAISAFYSEDSQSFEKALRAGKKDPQKLLAVFDRVSLEK